MNRSIIKLIRYYWKAWHPTYRIKWEFIKEDWKDLR